MKQYITPAALLLLLAVTALSQTTPTLKPGLYAVLETSGGTITAELYEKYTPRAVNNFVGLATGTKAWWDPRVKGWVKRPMYNGIKFHRIVREQMIQSGDPTGLGSHNCGFTIRDEYLPGLRFDRPGRATMVFHKRNGTWLGVHTHLSLNRGVPQASYGNRPVKSR